MSFPDDENNDGSQNIGLFTMRLLARESFIKFNCHQSFRLSMLSTLWDTNMYILLCGMCSTGRPPVQKHFSILCGIWTCTTSLIRTAILILYISWHKRRL